MEAHEMKRLQTGVVLLEALIGIVIFMLGALAMIALQANGIAAQSDAQYRIEAANQVDRLLGEINVNVDRTNPTFLATPPNLAASLALLAYNTAGAPESCNFSGSGGAVNVGQWAATVGALLPGSTASMQQVLVNTASFNQVTVTVCWRTASDATPRRHTVVAFIN